MKSNRKRLVRAYDKALMEFDILPRSKRHLRDLHIGIVEDQEERELFKNYGGKSWN